MQGNQSIASILRGNQERIVYDRQIVCWSELLITARMTAPELEAQWKQRRLGGSRPYHPEGSAEPHYYLGKGKLNTLRELITGLGAELVVCDDELTPAQQRGIARALETSVTDRTGIILDILPAAHTRGQGPGGAGSFEVPPARLVSKGAELSRLGGVSVPGTGRPSWRLIAGRFARASTSSKKSSSLPGGN